VERRQQQAALRQVLVLIEQQERAWAEDRLHEAVRVACVEHGRIAGEDLLQDRRIGDVDQVPHPDEADGEDVAVALDATLEKPQRVADEPRRLDQRRARGSRGKRHGLDFTPEYQGGSAARMLERRPTAAAAPEV
jgi:hypothetical protein